MPSEKDKLSRAEMAYQKILENIREGRLQPGLRITESDVANSLNMSRTPVREALRRLETAGLITIASHGMQISRLDYQEIMELYDMRIVLESNAARFAATHASDAEIFSLNEIMKRFEAATTPADQARHNRSFHNALAYAAHNRFLLKSLNSLRDSMMLLGKTTYELPKRAKEVINEHRAIVQAITDRNPEKAAEVAAYHIREAQKARITLLGDEIDPEF